MSSVSAAALGSSLSLSPVLQALHTSCQTEPRGCLINDVDCISTVIFPSGYIFGYFYIPPVLLITLLIRGSIYFLNLILQ